MFSPGTTFANRYRLESEIGRGAFGTVYRCYDTATSRLVALKILNDESNADATLKHRLRREAKLMAEMHTPHVARIYEFGESSDGRAYLAMELLEGRELNQVTKEQGPLPPDRVIHLVSQILAAVGEAHALGVVHRDLKPPNIFLIRTIDGTDFVKVLDFGIAKITGTPGGLSESARLTMHGKILGTPAYMSPEQCRGEASSIASDFYSIGIMAYEMLTGAVPFHDENPVQILIQHNTREPKPLPFALARSALGRAVMRALEKLPEHRFRTAEEFRSALTVPLPDASSTVVMESDLTSTTVIDNLLPKAESPSGSANASPSNAKAWLIPLALAAVVVAGVAWWLLRQ